jgi:hypothetical protein
MTTDQRIIKNKVGLLELVGQLGNFHARANVSNLVASPGRAQQFPDNASLSIALSSDKSATSFLS